MMIQVWLFDVDSSQAKRYVSDLEFAPREWVVPIFNPIWGLGAADDDPLPEPQLNHRCYDLFGLAHQATAPTGLKKDTRHVVGVYARRGIKVEPFEVWFGILADVGEDALEHVHRIAAHRIAAASPRR